MKTLKQFLLPVLESFGFAWQVIRYTLIFVSAFFGQRTSLTYEMVAIRSQLTFYEENIRQCLRNSSSSMRLLFEFNKVLAVVDSNRRKFAHQVCADKAVKAHFFLWTDEADSWRTVIAGESEFAVVPFLIKQHTNSCASVKEKRCGRAVNLYVHEDSVIDLAKGNAEDAWLLLG